MLTVGTTTPRAEGKQGAALEHAADLGQGGVDIVI